MTVRAGLSGIDYSVNAKGKPEGTNLGFYMVDVTAANFDAQAGLLSDIQLAVQGVSLIGFAGSFMNAVQTDRETVRPASPYAQRESKWLVTMYDSTNDVNVQFEIGGADLTLTGSDGATLDTAGAAGTALVAALEAGVVSRFGGACTFISAVHVGRNT